jgi:phytoene dehydrogenase-like protein
MGGGAGNIVKLARLGLQVRRLRRGGMEDLLRLVPMSVADLLDEWFESDALKGILGAAGVMHASRGPRSGGTALRLLHHHIGSPPGVFRQSCSNVRRVLRGLRGIDTRSNASVDRLNVEEGGIVGVTLAGGEEIAASLVVSGADPQRTLLDFLDTRWLDPELVRDVRNIRCRGVTVRVRLALDRVPSFSTLVVAPTLDYLEHAYDDAKYGRLSRAPYLEARAMAPGRAAQAHIEVDMQYAPYRLAEGEWNEDRRVALGELTLKALATHAPELKAAAITRVLTPRDLELEYGFPEGQPEHAEPGLDQSLFMRPLPELAHYRTPIKGLYLCGPATHPGGSIAGAAGHNAAREMMRDAKAR